MIYVHDVTNKILSRDLIYIVHWVMCHGQSSVTLSFISEKLS